MGFVQTFLSAFSEEITLSNPSSARDLQSRNHGFSLTDWLSRLFPFGALLMVLAVAVGARITYDWPFVHDAPLMHYVVFLMEHGRIPYRDIIDMNMPGTYIAESWAMHAFGGDAFGWWLWDALLGLTVIAGCAWIAGAQRKWAGVIAGALACMTHWSDGPGNLGQRDWLVSALLVLCVGCLFHAIRKQRPIWMFGFMLLCGAAASIKPPAILFGGALLIGACWQQAVLFRDSARTALYGRIGSLFAWSIAGGLAAATIVVVYMVRWGSFNDFVAILRGVLPYYARLHRAPPLDIASGVLIYKPLLLGSLFLFFKNRSWKRWDSNFLLLASACGALMFAIQDKGWAYHLYEERVLVSLWAVLELERAVALSDNWGRRVAMAVLAFTFLFTAPRLVVSVSRASYDAASVEHLEGDLRSLGGAGLSGRVQCLDMTMGGCINALYRLNIVQSSGFIYDFYLFPKVPTTVTSEMQSRFLEQMRATPPRLIVISSHMWPEDIYSYQKLDRWPEFSGFLQDRYALNREFFQERGAGYRIYMLKEAGHD